MNIFFILFATVETIRRIQFIKAIIMQLYHFIITRIYFISYWRATGKLKNVRDACWNNVQAVEVTFEDNL